MGLEEIEKLKARLEKDPSSKLFLPLAEEYRQAGMYDEAIEVLQRGLQLHPNYASARVALGKIYLEKGDVEKAREEFEKVVESVPENLFAQKKLAEIYRDVGNIEKAILHYEKVLQLNPADEESKRMIEELRASQETEEDIFESEDILSEEVSSVDSAETVETVATDESPTEVVAEETAHAPEDLLEDNSQESLSEDEAFQQYSEFTRFINEDVHEPESLTDLTSSETQDSEEDFSRQWDMQGFETTAYQQTDAATEYEERAETFDFRQGQDVESMFSEADEHIKAGRYIMAAETYQRILELSPDNNKARQRLEEIKYYIRFLGSAPEELVKRLEDFLGGIKKRQDEFFGHS